MPANTAGALDAPSMMKERDNMPTTATKHPASISAMLDAPASGSATFRTKAADAARRWDDIGEASPAAASPVQVPESYLSKQSLAAHYAMSVRWVEKRIAEGLPVADYMEGRPRLRLSETDPWLRERGHLTAERPATPRPGTKAGAA